MMQSTNMASADEDDEEVGLPALPHGTKNYMTPQCYRRMLDEREHLVKWPMWSHGLQAMVTAVKTVTIFTASAVCAKSIEEFAF